MSQTRRAEQLSPDDLRLARRRVLAMAGGYSVSQALYAAVALGVADHLEGGPKAIDCIAQACGCEASKLETLLQALCALGVFRHTGGAYALTVLSEFLLKSAPQTLTPMILFQGNEMYRAFGNLLANVRTGTPGWEAQFGCNIWEYFDRHPERGACFDHFMALGLDDIEHVAAAIDGQGARHIVDVGGGNGSLLGRLLSRESDWTGTLFDRSEVIRRASGDAVLRSYGERCRFVGGDFFSELPRGGDIYVMRRVLHDWSDGDCTRILAACHRAMEKSAKLVIIEALLGADTEQAPAWSNLGMMLLGGRERTLADFAGLLRGAGFDCVGTKVAGPYAFVIEAKAANG